jgi:hypothetical protein
MERAWKQHGDSTAMPVAGTFISALLPSVVSGKPARFTVASSSRSVSSSARMSPSGHELGPSDSAWSGRGCVSMKTPATPAAIAARASTGTNSRRPPLDVPRPPGSCTECGRVEHDRTSGLAHDREAPHVGHEVVIAERRAALADHDVVAPLAALALRTTFPHVLRREELPLLDVDRLAAARNRMDEIGLAAQERRRLQHVDDRCHFGNVLGFVDVGQHRDADLRADVGEDSQALGHSRPRNDVPELRFALSYDDLKMKGMPSAAQISFSLPATSIWSWRDSTTQGPQ